jgi:DNA-binding transcriptional LysR family regulator
MDLRVLRQFVAVAEELNFRRAAERLYMSQPPLSIAMQRLEGDLGVQLLRRDRQGVMLTPAGSALLGEARRLITQAGQSRDVVKRAGAGLLGTLRLSFFPSAAYELVPELLAKFRTSYPDVKVFLNAETNSLQGLAALRHADDVALVVPPLPGVRGVKVQSLQEEELVLAVPESHPLAGQKSADLKTLSHETFVMFQSREGPAFETLVLNACSNAGFLPRVEHGASQMLTVLALVDAQVGIALVPASMQAVAMPHLRYVQLRQGRRRINFPVALAYDPHNDNPVIPLFLSTVLRRRAEAKTASSR